MARSTDVRAWAKKRLLALLAVLLAFWITAQVAKPAPQKEEKETKNPLAGNPEAIPQGKSLFRLSCGFCHGLDGRGGRRGPDLGTGRWTHGASDGAIFKTITDGVAGTEMPANDLQDAEVWAIISYLRSLGAGSSTPITGNREEGEKIFFGSGLCGQCHMVKGKGGRLGPDLSRIGVARAVRHLIESLRQPDKEITPGFETVTVVTRDGRRITGIRKNEDTFSVQLMDDKEQLHLLLKKNLREVMSDDKKSLMPGYNTRMLDDKQLQDLLAYMDSLRGWL